MASLRETGKQWSAVGQQQQVVVVVFRPWSFVTPALSRPYRRLAATPSTDEIVQQPQPALPTAAGVSRLPLTYVERRSYVTVGPAILPRI